MANPEGAKAGEPYQNLDEGRSLPGVNYSPRLRRGDMRRGGAPLGKGDGGFRKRSLLYSRPFSRDSKSLRQRKCNIFTNFCITKTKLDLTYEVEYNQKDPPDYWNHHHNRSWNYRSSKLRSSLVLKSKPYAKVIETNEPYEGR